MCFCLFLCFFSKFFYFYFLLILFGIVRSLFFTWPSNFRQHISNHRNFKAACHVMHFSESVFFFLFFLKSPLSVLEFLKKMKNKENNILVLSPLNN